MNTAFALSFSFDEQFVHRRKQPERCCMYYLQNCNCFLRSRCSVFQMEISITLSVAISFRCFLKHIFVLKGLLKISSSFLVVLHSSVSLYLWHFHLNFPHCLLYLLRDVVWNHYQIFHQKQNNSKLIFLFCFFSLLSFKKSLQWIGFALSRKAVCIFLVTLKYALFLDTKLEALCCGSCMRADSKFVPNIKPGQCSAVPGPEEQIINRAFVHKYCK